MLDIPADLKKDYARLLHQRKVPAYSHNHYMKWLRFYLDFCHKYQHAPRQRASLPLFIRKLHDKGQAVRQQKQAGHAINLLYGCGLRLFECLQLRINCLNFDTMILTVHDGKG